MCKMKYIIYNNFIFLGGREAIKMSSLAFTLTSFSSVKYFVYDLHYKYLAINGRFTIKGSIL